MSTLLAYVALLTKTVLHISHRGLYNGPVRRSAMFDVQTSCFGYIAKALPAGDRAAARRINNRVRARGD
jgi:hypothetical protein